MAKPRKWASEHLALVSSYGIKWDADGTEWPHMLGERQVGRRRLRADFSAQMGLYILYLDNVPHYVGVADRLGERIHDHLGDEHKRKWNRVSWFGSKLVA